MEQQQNETTAEAPIQMKKTIKSKIKKWFIHSHIRQWIIKFYRFYTLKIMYPSLYKKEAKKPVDEKKVIFIEVRMTKLADSFELIYKKIKEEKEYTLHSHFLCMGFVKKLEYVRLCRAMVKDIADAKYIFIDDANDVLSNLPLRKETVLTQLWHACGAFKKFGLSVADLKFGENRKTLQKYPYHGNYTHMTVSAPDVVWAYEEAMGLTQKKGIVKPVGVSRTDVFYDEKVLARAKKRLLDVFPEAEQKKVILYAPTFRGHVASATAPDEFHFEKLKTALGDEYVFVVKHHPFVKQPPIIPNSCADFAKDLTKEMSIEDLLCVSDVCISDYSSLVFEFSLFEKPMIFFAPDLDDYFDWRGFYFGYDEFVPGPICKSEDEVLEQLIHLGEYFDKKKVQEFRKKYMSACDGHATERILELVFQNKK